MDNTSNELISLPALAREIGYRERTVRGWVDSGKLAVVVLPSGQMRVRRSDVEALLTPRPRPRDRLAERYRAAERAAAERQRVSVPAIESAA